MSTQVAKSQIIELRKPIPLKWRVSRAIPNKSNPTHVTPIIVTGKQIGRAHV